MDSSKRRHTPDKEEETPNITPTQLLNLAETHLRLRNYTLCQQYTRELLSSTASPTTLHAATQLLTVSSILDNPDNFYSVLQLDTFSSDPALLLSHFRRLNSLLHPVRHSSPMAHQAHDLLLKAYYSLSDPTSKAHFDTRLHNNNNIINTVNNNNGHNNNGDHNGNKNNNGDDTINGDGKFWTFCPYCFNVYEYGRVYEGCSLRCQNVTCRRVFHGVALKSLPKMELDKGCYFSCFGFFPIGFSPNGGGGGGNGGKFEAWSPIVGMFPMKRRPKKLAGRVGFEEGGESEFIEILDDSDESEVGGKEGVDDVEKPRRMKSVAWSRKRMRSNGEREVLESDEDGDENAGFGFEDGEGVAGEVGSGVGVDGDDVAFFEEDGEIYVDLVADDGGAAV